MTQHEGPEAQLPDAFFQKLLTDIDDAAELKVTLFFLWRVQHMEARGNAQVISCRVPLAEMFGYATDLRSVTQGRATYSMQFASYEQAPKNVSEEVVARAAG